MKTTQLTILNRELTILRTHLMRSNLSDYNKKKLLEELKNAKVVKDDELPENVICLDSQVEIADVSSRQKFTFQIVLPSEANMKQNRISVFAPIGIALLGYQTGSVVEWEMPTGLKKFEVLKVTQKEFA
ncbi:GreA/GreB family elongation factor [Arcticibacter sp. MXS-1]|uniref:GreA/GreB family elongation factor n=1 Tax=Arcticibacter sp. MXS-1 TaxID=3341726 RepID=UPI0035A95C02